MQNIPNEVKEKLKTCASTPILSKDTYSQIIGIVSSYIDLNISSNWIASNFLSTLFHNNADLYCALFDERICHAFLQIKEKTLPSSENFLSISQSYYSILDDTEHPLDSNLHIGPIKNLTNKFKNYLSSETFQKLQKYNIIHYNNPSDNDSKSYELKYTIHIQHSDEIIQYLTHLNQNNKKFTIKGAAKHINLLNDIKKHSNYPMLINYLYSTDENLPIYLSLTQACQDIIGKNVSEYAKTYQDIIEKKVSEYTKPYQDLIERDISKAIKKVKEDTLSTISKELTNYLISSISSLSHASPRIRLASVNETITKHLSTKTLFDIRYAIPLLTISIDYYLSQLSQTHDTSVFINLIEEYLYQKEISDYCYNSRNIIKNKSMNTQLNNSILSFVSTFCQYRIDHPITEYIPYVLPSINTSDYFSKADLFFKDITEAYDLFSYSIRKSLTTDIEKNIIPYICL